MRDLLARAVLAMLLMRGDGDLEQQHVQRRAEGHDGAHAEIIGQRELAGLGEVVDAGDDGARGERHGLINEMGRDDGRAVGNERLHRFALRVAAAHAGIAQGFARQEDRAEQARNAAGQRDPRRAEPEGAAADEQDGQHVLHDDEPPICAVLETRAGERGGVIEKPVRRRGEKGEKNQLAVEVELGADRRIDQRADRQKGRDGDEGRAERRTDIGIVLARALRIEARGGKPQPVVERRLHDDGDGEGKGEAPIFLGAEKLRDQQADDEIRGRIGEEGEEDFQGKAASPTIPRFAGEGVTPSPS